MRSRVIPVLVAGLLLGTSAACGSDNASGGGESGAGGGDQIEVVTSFYPLELAVKEIGGSHVKVTNLVKPGAEPHDLELTPKDVARVSDATLLVYEKGISGAVDDAAKNQAKGNAFDVAPAAQLDLRHDEGGQGQDHGGHGGEAPSASGQDGQDGHDHGTEAGSIDPHFWLDPVRYAGVAQAITARLIAADPAHKADYEKNARAFTGKLTKLAGELTSGLAGCRQKDLVTSHAAFGYLAQRVGLTQVPIAGLSPTQEPDSAALGRISSLVKKDGVRTIYTEVLADPSFAQAIARAGGAKTAVLDPVEGVSKASPGRDYFEIMRANLATLKKGQSCS